MTSNGASQYGHKNMKNFINKIISIFERQGIHGRVRITAYKAGTKEIVRQTGWMKNLVVSSANHGRNLICQRLAGTNTYSLNITHGEIGTGSTAPADSDTGLVAPAVRVGDPFPSVVNNVVKIQFFFSDAQLQNITYREFGTFVDGTITLGTGQLFNRILFNPAYTKAAGEDTTVEVEFTINSV
jgi:hypothetical protein